MKRMTKSRGDGLCECGTQRTRLICATTRPRADSRVIESREMAKVVLKRTLLREQEQ
jgi:hypothetical protein